VKPATRIAGEQQIEYEILAYLTEHPDAQDTLEGIVEWWFLEQQIKYRTAQVKKALTELVAKGLVLERKGRDTRVHYQINRRKSGEIAALLKQKSG